MNNKELDKLLAHEFPVQKNLIYLNHAAVSPLPLRTGDALKSFVDEYVHSGTKNYLDWARHADQLHTDLAAFINASSADDIALLKNTSEGISVVAMGFPWEPGDTVLSSDEEFPSNRIPWQALAERGVHFREVTLRQQNISPEQALIDAMDESTRMLAISAIQYGSGLRLNLETLGKACKKRNIAFCVDAIQMLGAFPVDVEAANIDFMMADSHKWLLGPEGIALFYCRKNWQSKINLFQYGWHMIDKYSDFNDKSWRPAASARRFENGTPNILGIRAFAASLALINEIGLPEIGRRILNNTALIYEYIDKSANLELIYTDYASKMSGIVTFRHKNHSPARLFNALRGQNIMCAERGGGVRFSPHVYNTAEEIITAMMAADEI